MNRRKNVILGFGLLAAVAAVVTWLISGPGPEPPDPTPTAVVVETVNVYGGYRFADEQMLAYLRATYGLQPIFQKIGTFDMAEKWTPDVDCIFPSSKTGIDHFQAAHPGTIRRSESIFQDPVVVFTWQEYVPTLEQAGLVFTAGDVHYLRMKLLLDAMRQDKQWADFGVDIPGYVNVESTDSLKSASGLMWLSLMAGYLVPGNETGGRVVTLSDLSDYDILPVLHQYWENQGMQVDTTGKMFPKFVLTHSPMVVAYESNYTDWYQSLPDEQKAAAEKIVGLYPEVTISTEHTLASTSPKCDQLLEVFASDVRIQELAWELAGVRNSAGGIGERPGSAAWIAATIPFVPEPKLEVTDAIKGCLADQSTCRPTAARSETP